MTAALALPSVFHCSELGLRFTREECRSRQGAVHEATNGPAFSPCGTGRCAQGREILVQIGAPVERTVIPQDHCPEHHVRRWGCDPCKAAMVGHRRALLAVAGRPGIHESAANRTFQAVVPIQEEPMPKGKWGTPCAVEGCERLVQKKGRDRCAEHTKIAAREERRGLAPPGPVAPKRASTTASPSRGGNGHAAPGAATNGLPEVRDLPNAYLVACAQETRRRVLAARELAEAVDALEAVV